MRRRFSWKENARYWQTVPRKSNAVLMGGVFCLFAAFGLVLAFLNMSWRYPQWAVAYALISGSCAVGYAHAGFRRVLWMLPATFALQLIATWYVGREMHRHVQALPGQNWTPQMVGSRLEILGLILMVCIIVGYSLVVSFIRREGQRVFRPLAEVQLAREVHQALVPEFATTIGAYEFYGISVPSGEVGGDLVDLIRRSDGWTAYVADVSGHGVPAGMIMSMVKSAVHMTASESLAMDAQLVRLNRVLKQLFAPNVFVTFACVGANNGDELQFAIAGHPPILHCRKADATVHELSLENPPLAVLAQAGFSTAPLRFSEGDVLAIITDGLSESSNKSGAELGLGPFKDVLLKLATQPLPAIARSFRDIALRQGHQVDDQTVLLVRKN
jgi:hypothetical protein